MARISLSVGLRSTSEGEDGICYYEHCQQNNPKKRFLIKRRDDGTISRTVKTHRNHKQQVKIRSIRDGIEISMPSLPGIWKKLPGIFGGLLGISGGFALIRTLWTLWDFFDWNLGGNLLVGIIWGIISLSCGVIGCVLLIGVFSKTTLVISQTTMTISRRKQTYELRHIWNVRFEDVEHKLGIAVKSLQKKSQKLNLLFNYGMEKYKKGLTIRCCEGISRDEAKRLVTLLSDILTFQCHVVERIIFGTYQSPKPDPYTTLQNPDVSALTTPFFHMKQIDIHAETYDFRLVERFLTYAINYLGQEYLRKHVEVHIYGDTEKLESNLYNNFLNLCKDVNVHEGTSTANA